MEKICNYNWPFGNGAIAPPFFSLFFLFSPILATTLVSKHLVSIQRSNSRRLTRKERRKMEREIPARERQLVPMLKNSGVSRRFSSSPPRLSIARLEKSGKENVANREDSLLRGEGDRLAASLSFDSERARRKAKRRRRFFPYFARLDTVVEKRGRKKLNGEAREDVCGRVGGPWSTRLGAPDA